jgi:hypothetical protein
VHSIVRIQAGSVLLLSRIMSSDRLICSLDIRWSDVLSKMLLSHKNMQNGCESGLEI